MNNAIGFRVSGAVGPFWDHDSMPPSPFESYLSTELTAPWQQKSSQPEPVPSLRDKIQETKGRSLLKKHRPPGQAEQSIKAIQHYLPASHLNHFQVNNQCQLHYSQLQILLHQLA